MNATIEIRNGMPPPKPNPIASLVSVSSPPDWGAEVGDGAVDADPVLVAGAVAVGTCSVGRRELTTVRNA